MFAYGGGERVPSDLRVWKNSQMLVQFDQYRLGAVI